MRYRHDLENGNNSQQLLEAINQGICNSLKRGLPEGAPANSIQALSLEIRLTEA
jgi:hypothetical protein